MSEKMILTIPKGYYVGDAKAAEGIAKLTYPGYEVEVVVSVEQGDPPKPRLEFLGRAVEGVDQFAQLVNSSATSPDIGQPIPAIAS